MSHVYVSLGSNVDRTVNMVKAVREMRRVFGEIQISPVYSSAAVGFEGDDFLNLVIGFETSQSVQQIVASFRQIEDNLGRDRSKPRYSPRPIDLDILIYDNLILDETGIQIPRREILKSSFVLKPLQDLIPDYQHPESGISFGKLWQSMAPGDPALEQIELDFE